MRSFRVRDAIFGDFCDANVCDVGYSNYINPISSHKFVTENAFSDLDFLYDANISPVNERLRAL